LKLDNKMVYRMLLYIAMFLISSIFKIIKLSSSSSLSYLCLSLIKKEYSFGYKTLYFSYLNKNLPVAKDRIKYLNNILINISKILPKIELNRLNG
jgi:hypothetical protein